MVYQAAIDDGMVAERLDAAGLAAMVGRYQHRLYRYLIRLVREPAAAEDLFQQTWLQAVREIRRYDARRSFDTWLFAIAHNLAMDLLRRTAGERLEGREELSSAAPDAFDLTMMAERSAIVAAEMEALPALYREALVLRFEEGMKLEEIAEVTGAPLSTVKSRVQRGLEGLRRQIASRWRKEDLL
jgi:RNA polymerase sigma-70 factor (ECF subfamily)